MGEEEMDEPTGSVARGAAASFCCLCLTSGRSRALGGSVLNFSPCLRRRTGGSGGLEPQEMPGCQVFS